ncbi:FtsX-like permease family protein [Pontibacter sp. H259]|uniref:ABC transporter permease n=1 Tax=Pontibacter sp. H259 TaxID=3133421 RepID=UPI0030C12598
MLKNYLKIAWKVLLRRKFFTFISLFGISITLMVLMITASFADYLLGAHAPETESDRLLYVSRLKMSGEGFVMNTSPGFYFLDKYVTPLKTPEDITIFSREYPFNVYVNNRKIDLDLRYTDSNFWNVLDFNFVEGVPFTKANVESIGRVVVINEAIRDNYFGKGTKALGKSIVIDRIAYEVVGVVENIPASRVNTYADVWVPYTNIKEDYREPKFGGSFEAILMAHSPGEVDKVKEEFYAAVNKAVIPAKDAANYDKLEVHADSMLEYFVRGVGEIDGPVNLYQFAAWVFFGTLFFMLLPTINLVNINISRIMERASEIGIRKSFGASSNTLVVQFLVENLILTLIGGLIGLVLAQGVLMLINNSGIIPYTNFSINPTVFAYSFLLCVFFGILSGVYPAYKMSKLPAVAALKGGVR